jgi:hypothetical protein
MLICQNLCRWVGLILVPLNASALDDFSFGPVYERFKLTLHPGKRTEALGPLFYTADREEMRTWAVPPLLSYATDEGVDASEVDFLYPVLTYDRYGEDYRFQLLQWLSWSGGRSLRDTNVHRFTLFPIFFQQRSEIWGRNYTALFPIYGRLQNRFFRDETHFVLWPLYVKTRRGLGPGPDTALERRSLTGPEASHRGITTYNFLLPFVHVRRGEGLNGWQFWPVFGREHKEVTTRTNHWEETEIVGGHDKLFSLWPIYLRERTGVGTENPADFRAVLPFYSSFRSPQRDSTSYLWPFGLTVTDDRSKKYREIGAPWPFIVFANGEGKTTRRVWPFYSRAYNTNLESGWYLWPLYKYNRIHSDPLQRERARVLLFVYSDTREKNTETGAEKHRRELWPLFYHSHDDEGRQRLQILSVLEPFAPTSRSIDRNYSQLWSLWRAEANPKTKASSQSLLWNLYRRDATQESRKYSLLFGLFQYQSAPDGRRWRLFYVPFGTKKSESPER